MARRKGREIVKKKRETRHQQYPLFHRWPTFQLLVWLGMNQAVTLLLPQPKGGGAPPAREVSPVQRPSIWVSPLALGGLLPGKAWSKLAHFCHRMMFLQTGTLVPESPRASSQQAIPVCSPARNLLCWSTFTEGKECCLAQAGMLVSLVVCCGPVSCCQWRETVALLCNGDESWQHKEGNSRPKAFLCTSEMPTSLLADLSQHLGTVFETFPSQHCLCVF